MSESIYIVGDVHGCVRTLARVLRRAGLIDDRRCWGGGRSSLYFVGDFTDRGPDGIGVLDLVMRLQDQAQSAGGHIGAILGNHDVFLLAADRFGRARPSHDFVVQWRRNGGRVADMERLHARHRAWLASHPAMRRVGDVLLVHADSVMYGAFGDTLEAVNAAVAAIVASADEERPGTCSAPVLRLGRPSWAHRAPHAPACSCASSAARGSSMGIRPSPSSSVVHRNASGSRTSMPMDSVSTWMAP